MKTKVKNFILLETRDVMKFSNFDEIYYSFEQIIDYDVVAYAIEGISERMTISLERIASEKIDRNDILSCFYDIVKCFEPFVKKILYLLDKKKYKELQKKDISTLPDYLEALGLKVFLDEKSRTTESQQLFDTYKLRNIESHECQKWSYAKIFNKLQCLFCAYLIVTKKHLQELKRVLSGSLGENEYLFYDISSFQKMSPEYILLLLKWGIFSINPMIKCLKTSSGSVLFNKDGSLYSGIYERNNVSIKTTYVYCEKEHISRRESWDNYISSYENSKNMCGYCEYAYDLEDRIVSADYYKQSGEKHRTIFLEYLSNGGLKIIDRNYRTEVFKDTEILFDNTGRLVSQKKRTNRYLIFMKMAI